MPITTRAIIRKPRPSGPVRASRRTEAKEPIAAEPWRSAFDARDDLAPFGDNALGLFALGLKFNLEDLTSIAADAITDGSDDKKCDIVYIDPDEPYAVVMQCFLSATEKPSAPANKASDLNTAVSWLLSREEDDLPASIRSAARALRQGVAEGRIKNLHFWFSHNLPESANVEAELKTVEAAAYSALNMRYPEADVKVSALEVGRGRLADWYSDTQSPVLVNDAFSLNVDAGFEIAASEWKAYVTAIPIQFIRSAYHKHGVKLFSANVRDYLGSISSGANINNGIKKTAETNPDNFWAFNNGLTILVNNYETPKRLKNGKTRFAFSGMSIVNGAQTTGAVASLSKAPPPTARVAVRFIKTENQDIVYDVIRYNNSQNKIAAADFRSTDAVQRRLKEDMAKIPGAQYEGGRRGGLTDAIKRRPNLLPSYTVGQALAALHGDPTVAYNKKSEIWSSDTLYSKYFNDQTTATHIVFAYGLLKAVESKKVALVAKSRVDQDSLTKSEQSQLAFLRRRGATFLLVAALSSCLEVILGKKIHNLFRVSFGPKTGPDKAEQHWADIVNALTPLATYLEDAFTYGLQNQELVESAIAKFKSLVEVTENANAVLYRNFAKGVTSR